jgi:mono/diheme cytochrome c family protein
MHDPSKQDHRIRTYGLQLTALLLIAVAGTALYWRAGDAAPRAPVSYSATPVTGGAGGSPISFKTTIEPIFSAHCLECHLAGQAAGGLHLDTYNDLLHGGNIIPGSIIVAGDHARSVLWQIIQPGGNWPGGNRMPLSGPPYLPDSQIQTIAAWIDQGAKDN